MIDANTLILLGAVLIFSSVLASLLSARFGFPLLVVFLIVGMLAGEDGPGGIVFDDFRTAFLVGNLALAVILLDGGLRTENRSFRVALRPATSLATVGVIVTAAIVAAFAAWLMNLDWRYALLLGAIVGSTDAAAVFSSLRHSELHLNTRVEATLEIESGANDPMAIFLVVLMIEWLQAGSEPSASGLALSFAKQLVFGAAGGVAGGYLLAALLARIRLVDGLYALLVVSAGLSLFAAINAIHGSGFLAIYLAGLMVANRPTHATEHVLRVMDGIAWLAQAGMFLVLGLLVTPSRMLEDVGPAIAIAAFLMLVARPVAVSLSLLPFRFPAREVGFVSWVGLRGAVPIVLSVFPVMAGLENSSLLFNVTFVVVLFSLVVQGGTIPLAARLFRVQVPRVEKPVDRTELSLPTSPTLELVQLIVERGASCIGRNAVEFIRDQQPANGSCAAIVRELRVHFPDSHTVFEPEDVAVLILPVGAHERIAPLFTRQPEAGPLSARSFFGEFVLDGSARVADVLMLYGGGPAAPGESDLTIAALLESRFGRAMVVGDRISLDRIAITVREIREGHVARVGLKLTD